LANQARRGDDQQRHSNQQDQPKPSTAARATLLANRRGIVTGRLVSPAVYGITLEIESRHSFVLESMRVVALLQVEE
jgi:hypothetical protein